MKRAVIALILVLALVGGVVALAAAGDPSDPLVTLSYLLGSFRDSIFQRAETKTEESLKPVLEAAEGRASRVEAALPGAAEGENLVPVSLEQRAKLELPALSGFVLTAGSARLSITAGEFIDLSAGKTVPSGSLLEPGHRYLAAENAAVVLTAEGGAVTGLTEGPYTLREPGSLSIEELFPDVAGHWGASYVDVLYRRGVVNGVAEGSFAPNGTVTRAMLVTILGRADGTSAASGASRFSDVSASAWYAPYVAWAESCGVVQGYEDGTFRPNSPVTREQMALIFARYASYKGLALAETEAAPFADADSVSSWAREAVTFAQRTGLMNGKENDRFDPRGTATRAEICAVTARFLEKTGL